ncbi:PAQR family membrane homeostasis protein TrhA [Shewanella glacialipiscicola]|uniref:Channel protein hemolysin III family subfamily YqfA n=1 Tax=Shewanella glacialipiscicola TaxID=614069 RepID=A0ABQ6J3V7_9GAMM|nr:hemolysin III family protein [Shewanella glacialipiscicola]MCL1085913.1 hemolysin III family protein [Shewanella glacialipiscicola]MCU7993389.1 hemolysin III family protein [Shewanella glacialipiscicola]MCU8024706.1 hemolysin III family protein [Shewanella glacialipiscicola]GIU16979.1 channel protein hemolysin III family subfamily YqfA [Shewanella glacialipiscicola]GMA81980.1 channel protein hemolysin III family subfamily YqfA [Shewanella glacialipiscicola]
MSSHSIIEQQNTDTVPAKSGPYSIKEEIANSASHGLGVIAGIVALVLMLLKGQDHLTSIQLAGVVIYGASIIMLFLCSTLYHSVSHSGWKHKLKIADHCAIYCLIAGTYTPLMLISLQGTQSTVILTAIWSLAMGGILFKTLFIHKFKKLSLVLYLAMGWLCVTVIGDLTAAMSELGFNLLILGGLFYTLGVVFYVGKRIPFNHAIWHLFVLGGAISHFLCIYLTVI